MQQNHQIKIENLTGVAENARKVNEFLQFEIDKNKNLAIEKDKLLSENKTTIKQCHENLESSSAEFKQKIAEYI